MLHTVEARKKIIFIAGKNREREGKKLYLRYQKREEKPFYLRHEERKKIYIKERQMKMKYKGSSVLLATYTRYTFKTLCGKMNGIN